MTTPSTCYAGPLLTLLLPAVFAVWFYSCGGFRFDDCADPSALLETGWIEGLRRGNEPGARPSPWLLHGVSGSVATRDRGISPLEFQIFRSFELERV